MFSRSCLLLLALVGLALAANRTARQGRDDQIDLAYYYTVNSDQDADFYISQVIPELQNPNNNLYFMALPYGRVQIITDEGGNYYCHGKKDICQTSQIQFCIELEFPNFLASFLSCFFESEFFPVDILGATEQCMKQLKQADLDTVKSCTQDEDKLGLYNKAVLSGQELRPLFDETPHVYLNEDYSALATIDLKKALCRVKATDIWQCESVDQYKEPVVEIFYTVYDQKGSDFFTKQFTQTVAQNLITTVSRLDILPNPNKVIDCDSKDDSCWSHQAHWCIFDDYAGLTQLEIIQCTFGKSDSLSAQDRVKQCVPEDRLTELINCIAVINESSTAIKRIQSKLNLMIEPSQQTSVEVTVKDQPNAKVKNGVLQEVCYNYFHVDDETLGCKVSKPKVQIFYETQSKTVMPVFDHMSYFAQLAPFATIADFEFIPYGNTKYANGNYTCDGGFNQCHANWLQACLFKDKYNTIEDQFRFMQFFSCVSNYVEGVNPVDLTEACLNQNYLEGPNMWGQLIFCAQNDDALKEQLRTKTDAIGLTQIPEIVIDGEKKTSEVGNHLLVNLCQSFDPIKPRACFQIDSTSNQMLQVLVYLTGDQATQAFVQSQIKPLLTAEPRDTNLRLREIIEWQFVPWGPSEYNSTSGEIECATGDNECLVNRILTCATRQPQNGFLGIREDRLRVVSFLVCFFDSANWQSNPLDIANQCSPKLSPLDNFPFWQCAVQDSQQQLVLEMKDLTENNYPAITKFPEVTIQNQRQKDLTNLVQSLCSYYKAWPVPSECTAYTTVTPGVETTPAGKASVGHVSTILLITLLLVTFCLPSSTHVTL